MDIEKLFGDLESQYDANRLLITNAFVEKIVAEFKNAHPGKNLEILFGNGDFYVTIDGETLCPIWGDDAVLTKYSRLFAQLNRLDSFYTHGITADHISI